MRLTRVSFERAAEVAKALRCFMEVSGCADEFTLQDLLTGLLHWCDHNDVDFNELLAMAREQYDAANKEAKGAA